MFSPKQLLINCATLLCLEHREGVATTPSNELVNNILASLPIPESTIDHDHGRQTFLELRSAVMWLNTRTAENFPSESEILQQFQVACREENYLYEALLTALLEKHDDVKSLIKVIHSYRAKLSQHLNDEKILSILKEYHHKLTFKRGQVHDIADEIMEMAEKLDPLVSERARQKHPAMMASMDFGAVDELEQHLREVQVAMSTEGAIRFGWKALNRMLGKVGALRRGEFKIVGGLQHNFKSGWMLSLFTHAALFNTPYLRDKTRKPLLLFVSFENDISDNLLWIYKYLKENETGEAVIDSQVNLTEASAYVAERMRETGFEVQMVRFDPTEFTAASFIGYLEGIQADGYEIVTLFIDYLNMMSKAGIEAKVAGDDIRLLFRRVRNYCAPRGIACITPHQLSSDALQLTRENVEDFVKVVANKGYYDGCRRLGQEPDLEVFIHIVAVNGKKYLTVQRGKHRSTVTPEKDLYFVLPFHDIGTIPWDVDKEHEITLAMPGGGALGSDEEVAWWAM